MLKETLICDRCDTILILNSRDRHQQRISLLNGESSIDIPSGRTDYHTDDYDLCASCLGTICRMMIKELTDEEQKSLLMRI
jgi:hypothetical protein